MNRTDEAAIKQAIDAASDPLTDLGFFMDRYVIDVRNLRYQMQTRGYIDIDQFRDDYKSFCLKFKAAEAKLRELGRTIADAQGEKAA